MGLASLWLETRGHRSEPPAFGPRVGQALLHSCSERSPYDTETGFAKCFQFIMGFSKCLVPHELGMLAVGWS